MVFSWLKFLECNRSIINEQWVERLLSADNSQYSRRPKIELVDTVSRAFQANLKAIAENDYRLMDDFIDFITRFRLEAGFALQDVQGAFEVFRDLVLPMIYVETQKDEFYKALAPLNHCLAYTIFRFSDRFQKLNEKQLVELAGQLEAEVEARTSELRASELNYKTLVEEIHDGYLVVNDGRVVFVNAAFCKMHGYILADVLQKKFACFVAPEDTRKISIIDKPHQETMPAGAVFEYMRLTRDGKRYPTEITVKTTMYRNQLSTIGLCRDITQRVKMEKRVRDAERMATIGRITTSLSHEIRNPLSAVKLNLQILKKNNLLQGNDQRRIDISVQEVNRLESILKELLDFAKPVTLKPTPCDLNAMINQCIELLDIKFREKRLSVNLVLDGRIGEVLLDPEKIQQAIINLLLNAIDASPNAGRVELRTQYQLESFPPEVIIMIRDQGEGVEASNLESLFEPFFTTKSQGTGLGLTNVKRVVVAHGGSVAIDPLSESGAAFYIFLPLGGHLNGKGTRCRR